MKRAALFAAACVTLSAFSALAEPETSEVAAPAEPAAAAPAPSHAVAPAVHPAPHASATHAAPATTHAAAVATHAAAPAVTHPAVPAQVSAPAAQVPAPEAAAAPVAAPPAPVAPAPAAAKPSPSASPSWLRPDKPMAKPALEMQHGPSPLRIGSMLLLVAGLGGVAMYARRKRQGAGKSEPKSQLKLLGTTRVGPKATAVVVEVSGKRLLLGVTEQSVSTLAWLDDEANAAVDEGEPSGVAERPASVARAVDDVAAAGPSGFLKLLRNAVGTGARPGAAVDEVVKTTRDEVRLSSRREAPRQQAEEPVAFEGQVMGLAKRRRESK